MRLTWPSPGRHRSVRLALGGLLVLIAVVLSPQMAAAQDGGEAIGVRVQTPGPDAVRHAGVAAAITDANGEQVASGVTDDNGEVELGLPGPGDYVASIDPATLPEGFVPRDGVVERETSVQAGRTAFALFALDATDAEGGIIDTGTPGERTFADKLESVPQLFVDGIKLGSIIAITAIGLSLIFGATGLVNFAHGELVTLGAVVAFLFNASTAGPQWHLIIAALIATVVGAGAGTGLEVGVWAPLRKRGVGLISMLVISIGLSFIIRNVIQIIYGGGTRPYTNYNIQSAIDIGPISIVPRDLWIIVLSFVVLVAVGLMLQKTKIGKALRAVADNKDLAESSGINVDAVIRFVWMLGGALSAFGGVLLGTTEQVNFNMGFNLLLLMFAGMILGGLGTAYGAMVGSLVVGVISQVSTAFFSVQLKFVWALVILIIVLLVKPQGILGKAERFG